MCYPLRAGFTKIFTIIKSPVTIFTIVNIIVGSKKEEFAHKLTKFQKIVEKKWWMKWFYDSTLTTCHRSYNIKSYHRRSHGKSARNFLEDEVITWYLVKISISKQIFGLLLYPIKPVRWQTYHNMDMSKKMKISRATSKNLKHSESSYLRHAIGSLMQ